MTRKKEEESKSFKNEFENALKSEDFDEEWEQCLFRICYVNPDLNQKFQKFQKF